MLFAIGYLAIAAIIASFLFTFILNLAGLPGALIARNQPRAQSWRWFLGFSIAVVGQLYLAAAYVAFIVNWTSLGIQHQGLAAWLFWPIAFLASIFPVFSNYSSAVREADEDNSSNVALDALGWTMMLSVPIFFVFVFAPIVMHFAFTWIPYIN